MDLILCHTNADFDALGAAVGVARLMPGAKIVLTGGCHPVVRDFLALHRDEYALIERRAVNPQQIRSLVVVDTPRRDRLGKAAEWLDLPQLAGITVYDHHLDNPLDIPATHTQIEPVGATTTLIVEQLQMSQINLTVSEATVMALGIHADTGSLTFDRTTARDGLALAWLMQQGVSLRLIAEYLEPGLSPQLQELLARSLENLRSATQQGYTVSWVLLTTSDYVPGLSSLAAQLMELTESDALLLAARYPVGDGDERLDVIGRSQISGTDLNQLFQPLGGGGHSKAASLTLRGVNSAATLRQLVDQLQSQIPQPPTARELMSSPVRTIRPETNIGEAQRILLRYGHSGLSVVSAQGQLVGVISRRDIDIALHHGFSHAPVKGYMTTNLKTITPDTTLSEIQSLMVTYDIGRLPVLASGQLMGIVTRTDVLRELHQHEGERGERSAESRVETSYRTGLPLAFLRDALASSVWELLSRALQEAEQRGWQLYLVGGAIRDLLLANPQFTPNSARRTPHAALLIDLDLVVDGHASDVGAGVELARALQQIYPSARLEIHGAFQTAALSWHKDQALDSLLIDIATARTEFYPYPAANPEVEASSIRQDLYRRDFTINALAVRLTPPRTRGTPHLESQKLPLLDFFGGLLDLHAKQIRVLHANSFIEDPTRIYRAVRFAVRLGFEIESQTAGYIRYAIASGIYTQRDRQVRPALQTRLRSELQYILQAPYWKLALRLLADLGALQCIHPTLELDDHLWRQLRLGDRCLRRLDPRQTVPHWLFRLEVVIAQLAPEHRGNVARNLQLPEDSINRLEHLAQLEADMTVSLAGCHLPSQVVQLLHQYKLPTLILLAIRTRSVRRQIWRYFTHWKDVQAPLNGDDLKALGYRPGPQYRQILEALLAATLDGGIGDRASAEVFLAENYPLAK